MPNHKSDQKTNMDAVAQVTAANSISPNGAAPATSTTGSNNPLSDPSLLRQYEKSIENLVKLQANPDENLKIIRETGAHLAELIEAAPNFSTSMTELQNSGSGLPSPAVLAEIQQKQKQGVFIYKLTTNEGSSYRYLEFSKQATASNNFNLSTKPKCYSIQVGDNDTRITTSHVNLITDRAEIVVCPNSVLAFGKNGELRITERPVTANELGDAFDAAEDGRCSIM